MCLILHLYCIVLWFEVYYLVLSEMILVCIYGFFIYCLLLYFIFFCFKQKTAYDLRMSDWSSDVCSSDLCSSPWGARTPAPALLPAGGTDPAACRCGGDRASRLPRCAGCRRPAVSCPPMRCRRCAAAVRSSNRRASRRRKCG